MKQVFERLVRYNVSCARAFELDEEAILAPGQEGHSGAYGHENFRYAAGLLLALYVTEHPANPYCGKPETLAKYVTLADHWVSKWEKSAADGKPVDYSEWPPLMVLRGLDLVGGELAPEMRGRWTKFITYFAEHVVPQPFFYTAPNHEAWKLAVAAIAGRVLSRPDLTEAAEFKAGQIIRYQTPEGFWEEGRHHGPSMKYNSLMLAAMSVIAKETGSEGVRAAAARLSAFMADWCFPDGVTAGVFDGRQSTSPGYFGRLVPGLELAPRGVASMRRIMDFWERAKWLDEPRAAGPSNWYAHFGMPFAYESLLYYADTKADPAAEPMSLDADGAVVENHSTVFDGVMRRDGDWAVALSGQLSDVPKDCQFIYRLERQSRIELWHQRASVVAGGGHSLINCVWPLYNVWAESGYGEEPDPSFYAHTDNLAASPAYALRRSKYYPRHAASGVDGNVCWLELVFAHCTIRFELEAAGGELAVRYSYRQLGLEELRLALPMVLWRTAKGLADGKGLPDTEVKEPVFIDVERTFAVETPLFGTKTTLTLPSESKARAVWPLEPVRTYGKLFDDEKFESFFRIAQVETVIEKPAREGSGEWRLRVE